MEIWFRVDGDETIGMGHVMRCLAIANAVVSQGGIAYFLTKTQDVAKIIEKNGHKCICIYDQWGLSEDGFDIIQGCIEKFKIGTMVIDSYLVTEKYLEYLIQNIQVVYLDDFGRCKLPVSMVIHYGVENKIEQFNQLYKKSKTKLLIGTSFVPLRKEFEEVSYRVKEKVDNILVMTGGTDPYHILTEIAKRVVNDTKLNEFHWHFVLGRYHNTKEELQEIRGSSTNIIFHEDVTEMKELMCQCDLAITAGGTTTYELCACGVPTICYSFVENQLDNVKALEKKKGMIYVGDYRENRTRDWLDGLVRQCNWLIEHPKERREYSQRMNALIDGMGARRIAEQLMILEEGR